MPSNMWLCSSELNACCCMCGKKHTKPSRHQCLLFSAHDRPKCLSHTDCPRDYRACMQLLSPSHHRRRSAYTLCRTTLPEATHGFDSTEYSARGNYGVFVHELSMKLMIIVRDNIQIQFSPHVYCSGRHCTALFRYIRSPPDVHYNYMLKYCDAMYMQKPVIVCSSGMFLCEHTRTTLQQVNDIIYFLHTIVHIHVRSIHSVYVCIQNCLSR